MRANALIKRGSMHMQEGNSTEAMADFATAVRIDPDNADIYHHRGQVNIRTWERSRGGEGSYGIGREILQKLW